MTAASRRAPRPRGGRTAATLAALLLAAGCTDAPAAPPRLVGGAAGLNDLGRRVWEAVVAGDTAALGRLRLSEREHETVVWPGQPAAAEPSAAARLDLWWANIDRRSRAAERELLGRWSGSRLTFARVDCRGEPRGYGTFAALTGCVLVLEGPAGAAEEVAFRQVVRADGVYKVVRYARE